MHRTGLARLGGGTIDYWSVVHIMKHSTNVRFGVLLRNARKRVGMTQRQLAELSTISVRAIRDLELESTKAPRIQTISLLADALRLSKARRAELESAAGVSWDHPLIEDVAAPPAPLGPIIGRDHESGALAVLLQSSGHRLLEIVGMPGIGKSQLILKVAHDLHHSRRMPVVHLGRETARREGQPPARRGLIERIADQTGCEPTVEDVTGLFAGKDVLLTVDGRELDEDGRLELRLLLHRCSGLRVLYETSEISSAFGGSAFSVFPLSVPEWRQGKPADPDFATYPTVQFMLSRCAQLYPHIAADPAALSALAGICWLLDGIPAALEIAASWLLVHDPAQLLDIATRSPLILITSPIGSDDALVSWLKRTVGSLSSEETAGLSRLADVETWTVEEAIGMLRRPPSDALRVIHLLRTYGLVRQVHSVHGGRTRFAVLNLVRHLLDADASGPTGWTASGAGHVTRADSIL